MQAFSVNWQPSPLGKAMVWLLHGMAILACLWWFRGIVLFLGIILLVASAYWAWQQQNLSAKDAIVALEVDEQGHAAVRLVHERHWIDTELLAGSLIHRRICFLAWRICERTVWQCVLPDMTDADAYRRLLVWARFGQPKE